MDVNFLFMKSQMRYYNYASHQNIMTQSRLKLQSNFCLFGASVCLALAPSKKFNQKDGRMETSQTDEKQTDVPKERHAALHRLFALLSVSLLRDCITQGL